MKTLFCVIILFSLLLNCSYSQDIRSFLKNENFSAEDFIIAGDSCAVYSPERHDDFTHENGYLQNSDSTRFVLKMTPAVYPWIYSKVCVAWTRLNGASGSIAYDVVVYDTTGPGGVPGNLVAVITGQSLSGIPVFPQAIWNSTTINVPVISNGSYYIGVRWKNSANPNTFISGDESAATPQWPGFYSNTTAGTPVWNHVQTIYPGYRCLCIRTEAPGPLCEQFIPVTFPPAGWSLAYTGTLYWSRNTSSVFCQASGSAKFDCYNAVSGTTQSLITKTFSPTVPGDSLYFYNAYCTFTTENDVLQIFASSNGGASYGTPVILNGGVSGPLVTAPPQTAVFTPTCAQWKKQVIGIPPGTNTVKFTVISGFGNNLYLDSICPRSGIISGITGKHEGVPSVYSLSQNYPNPFNPSTTIHFGIPKPGFVKLAVYDITGRQIAVLIDGYESAGTYKTDFDGTNFASGIYFYTLSSADFMETKKMLLVK